ncbi:hypothetical protein ACWEWD_24000 [Streptomyces tendae]
MADAFNHIPAVVLPRIKNAGRSPVVAADYVAPASDPVGIRIAFHRRRVVGVTVTERSPRVPPTLLRAGWPRGQELLVVDRVRVCSGANG